jgi:hypothetical protein
MAAVPIASQTIILKKRGITICTHRTTARNVAMQPYTVNIIFNRNVYDIKHVCRGTG